MTQPIKIGKKLLIADDEPHILRTLDDLLTAEGYIIFKATDGKKALEQAESALPDLIVLDVMMPKMDGFEVLKRLKKNPKTMDIPVIMLTVKSTSHDIEEGIKLYAEKYITKPFSSDALLQEIEKSLSIRDKGAPGA
jgi:CheY-like chemotaxis protein